MIKKKSFTYEIINELLNNKNVSTYIRLYILFMLYEKNGREIWASNQYLSNRLSVSLSNIKRGLNRLKTDKLIYIDNVGSWKRKIRLLKSDIDSYYSDNILTDLIEPKVLFDYDWLNDPEHIMR